MQNRTADRRAVRGTKRKCREEDCGERFYDLNRDPMTCPYCGKAFVSPEPEAVFKAKDYRKPRQYKLEKPQPALDDSEEPDSDNVESNDTDSLEEIEDTGGATSLLDRDGDEDVHSTEVAKATLDLND